MKKDKQKTLSKIRQRKLETPQGSRVPLKWLYPTNIEIKYHRELKVFSKQIRDKIKEFLLPEIPSMVAEVNMKVPNDRNDDYLDRLHAIILFIRKALNPDLSIKIAQSFEIGLEIDRFNKAQFEKVTNSVFGINLYLNEPWLQDQLKLFAAQNAQLITSMPDKELGRVSGIIERGLQEGTSYKDIAKDIRESFGITDRRAKLIARDQTKKLNSSLTKLRQTEVGVEEYIWQTVEDERVRASHAANNGKKFRWDTPPAKTGHPGNDVNCRCIAMPVLDKLLG